MTTNHDSSSRLERIEALMLELATASVRHDNEFSRINGMLDRLTIGQEQNRQMIADLATAQEQMRQRVADLLAAQEQERQAIAALTAKQDLNQEAIAALTAKQDLNQEAIATLTASIQELRNLTADHLRGHA